MNLFKSKYRSDPKIRIEIKPIEKQEKCIKVGIPLPETKHREFKKVCAMRGLKLQDVSLDLILNWIEQNK